MTIDPVLNADQEISLLANLSVRKCDANNEKYAVKTPINKVSMLQSPIPYDGQVININDRYGDADIIFDEKSYAGYS